MKEFVCSKCNSAYSRHERWEQHMENAHGQTLPHNQPKPYQCSHCKSCYSRRERLREHLHCAHRELVQQHQVKFFQCSERDTGFLRHDTLVKHKREEQGRNFQMHRQMKCPFQCNCDNFYTVADLVCHCENEHKENLGKFRFLDTCCCK